MKKFKVTNEMYKNAEIIDDEIVVTDDDEIEIERFINFEIED